MTAVHYDEVNVTELARLYTAGDRNGVASIISTSDNPAHTALALAQRMLRDTDVGDSFPTRLVGNLMSTVEYNCISHDEDVIAELRAGDIPGALHVMGVAP